MSDRNHLGHALAACALLLGACQSEESGGPIGKADVGPVIGAGFSAALRADLAKATGIPAPAVAAAPAAGDKNGGKPAAVAVAPETGAGKPAAVAPETGAGKPAVGDKPAPQATGDKPVAVAVAPETGAGKPAAGGDKPAAGTTAPTAPTPTPEVTPAPVGTTGGAAGLPAELAAVKLTLNEGWTRDAVGPGTFSFFAPGEGGKNIRFVFRYAYEDATAPTQRDPYIQWLASTKAMNVTVNRQRGAAWFLEGTDGAGVPSFRYVITYGGRLLTCGGSLYKQGAAAGLRDLRDELIMQAKRICESIDF
jgi:hypothetical protein